MAAAVEMLELVPEPGSGRVFEFGLTPGAADVTGSGRSRLDAIARWLQEVARSDLADAGFERQGAWIVRRMRISVRAFPRYQDELVLRTFCSGIGRFSAERRTSIRGGAGEVEAVSRWVCLDPEVGRPQRFSDEFRRAYAETAAGREANVRVRHPDPSPGAKEEPWEFRASDIDLAGHVNNSHFWAPLEQQLLGEPEPEALDAEVEHREPALPGPARLVSDGELSWVLSTSGEVHASIARVLAGQPGV